MELPVIEVSGSKYEIGYQHGQKAKEQIAVNIDIYKEMFMEYANIDWERAKKIALTFEKDIAAYKSEYLDEIRGIADGSGYEYAEILALNVRSELVFQGTQLTSDGCTSLAVTADRTTDGTTYIGQNWDWKVNVLGGVILLKIHQEGIPDIATMTEAGIVGKIGCNSAGVGVCFNALSVDAVQPGVPIHIILRDIMEQPNFAEAMTVVSNNAIGCPANIVIASEYGEAIDFEVEVGDFDALYPKEGVIVHTNHYVSPIVPRYNHKDITKLKFPDTFIRYGRIKKLTEDISGKIDLKDIETIFTNHTEPSCSICHHEEHNGIHGGGIGTVFSIIMDLKKRVFYVSFGQPCQNEYKKYSI